MRAQDSRYARYATVVALLGLTGLGLALRFYALRNRGVWWDEVSTWFDALSGHRSPQEAPLNSLLVRGVMTIMQRDDAFALHVAAALFGTLTIPVAYFLGAAIATPVTGLVAALLVTISPMLLAFSQEARPYALLILLSSTQLCFAVRLLTRWSGGDLAGLLVASSGALATHLIALPFTAALGGVLFLSVGARWLRERDHRRLAGKQLLALVGGGVLAIALGLSWAIARPSFNSVMTGPYTGGPLVFIRYILTQCGPGFAAAGSEWGRIDLVAACYVVLALVGVIALCLRGRVAVAACLLLSPMTALVGLYLQLGEKSTWPWFRYATPTLVPFLMLVAAGLSIGSRVWLTLPLVLGLLSTHRDPAHGIRAWSVDARIRRGVAYHEGADQLARNDEGYVGTIFAPEPSVFGDESDRLTSSYAIYRTDQLPAYFAPWYKPLTKIEWKKVVGRRPVPIRTDEVVKDLPPGRYAVFLGWDSYRGCKFLSEELVDPDPPIQSGLYIPCIKPVPAAPK